MPCISDQVSLNWAEPSERGPGRVVEQTDSHDWGGEPTEISRLVTPPPGRRITPIDYFDDLAPGPNW